MGAARARDIVRTPRLGDLGGMLTWMSLAVILTGSLTAMVVKIRAYLLAVYLWHKTQNLDVLREVGRFERQIR